MWNSQSHWLIISAPSRTNHIGTWQLCSRCCPENSSILWAEFTTFFIDDGGSLISTAGFNTGNASSWCCGEAEFLNVCSDIGNVLGSGLGILDGVAATHFSGALAMAWAWCTTAKLCASGSSCKRIRLVRSGSACAPGFVDWKRTQAIPLFPPLLCDTCWSCHDMQK